MNFDGHYSTQYSKYEMTGLYWDAGRKNGKTQDTFQTDFSKQTVEMDEDWKQLLEAVYDLFVCSTCL